MNKFIALIWRCFVVILRACWTTTSTRFTFFRALILQYWLKKLLGCTDWRFCIFQRWILVFLNFAVESYVFICFSLLFFGSFLRRLLNFVARSYVFNYFRLLWFNSFLWRFLNFAAKSNALIYLWLFWFGSFLRWFLNFAAKSYAFIFFRLF